MPLQTDHTVPYGTAAWRAHFQAFHARLPSFRLSGTNTSLPFPNIPPEIAAIEFNHADGIVGLSACAENRIAYSGNP
jgi:hypothetical protein